MIVASLLLIPVAVLFLALGLNNGSSSLLIASIVVSLLAAVALVVGPRQSAGTRRGVAGDVEPDDYAPQPPPMRRAPAAADDAAYSDETAVHDFPPPPAPSPEPVLSEPVDTPPWAGDLADQAGTRTAAGHAEPQATRAAGRDVADSADSDSAAEYARSAERPEPVPAPAPQATEPEPAHVDPVYAEPVHAEPVYTEPEAEQADEFAEPDADDPDDEPLPQSVRPADAVLVARLDTEVLVVDGRPRYHMADCPHLVGRLTEPLPANEAVELGFSPCGLCRPVDRLVAAVAHG
ncbi:hypothetical protein [Actinoplanes rectilineatus]|uniref:hypothetical protein n=1 Tax=Actinoplanes rectilineatus TaxID=113571 RepID=UPI0009F9E0F0|nr:hypothetical protein [Actinoplanes rectilineatus]